MPSSQSEWDAKHRLAVEAPPPEPANLVHELLPLLPRGRALDIACGTGRHTLLLATRGQHVTAIDWSAAALGILETHAEAMGISVRRVANFERASAVPTIRAKRRLEDREQAQKEPFGLTSWNGTRRSHRAAIDLMQADLEHVELPEHTFDLILCIQYLQRSLFAQMCCAVRPNGILLFETYTRAQLAFAGGPRTPAFLLEPGELRSAFPELRVLFYRELRAGQGIASLLAQKPGQKS